MWYFEAPVVFTVRFIENEVLGIYWTLLSSVWIIFLKCTCTDAFSTFDIVEELWISWFSRFKRIQFALYPKMNNMHYIRLDFPDPLGPTTLVKF